MFCATDLLACGFMDAARNQFSLSVPDQLCVAGFDNIEQAGWESYDLTTFDQPVDQIAQQAVDWLSAPHSAPAASPTVTLHAELVWRSSIRGG